MIITKIVRLNPLILRPSVECFRRGSIGFNVECYKRNRFGFSYNDIMKDNQLKGSLQKGRMFEKNTALFEEGHAKIYTKYLQKNGEGKTVENQVFYNPVQIFNRDLSVLIMQGYINSLKQQKGQKFKGVTIADCLSASGLRTIRYIKELQGVKTVYANDLLPAAQKLMKDNFQLNSLDNEKYKITLQDANVLLRDQKSHGGFDIIDLDPYGSVVPFLDAALYSVKQGGLLCITCTDTRVLCGPDLTKCFYYYGTTRAKVQDYNQNALRILLSTISSTASRHCKYIVPLISLQTDFYVRVFVRAFLGKKQSGQSGTKIGNIYNCQFCGNYESKAYFKQKKNGFVPQRQICSAVNCTICGHPYQLNGPVWLDRLNHQPFAQQLIQFMGSETFHLPLATKKKIYGVLHGIVTEGPLAKVPLSFNFDLMNKNLHATGLSKQSLINAVKSLEKDHLICSSYLSPGHYKSSLPLTAIYDIIKSWKLKQFGADKYLSNVKHQNALNILKGEIKYKPDFQFKSQQKIQKVPRFISMGKNMGPKGKAAKRILQQPQLLLGEQKLLLGEQQVLLVPPSKKLKSQ